LLAVIPDGQLGGVNELVEVMNFNNVIRNVSIANSNSDVQDVVDKKG